MPSADIASAWLPRRKPEPATSNRRTIAFLHRLHRLLARDEQIRPRPPISLPRLRGTPISPRPTTFAASHVQERRIALYLARRHNKTPFHVLAATVGISTGAAFKQIAGLAHMRAADPELARQIAEIEARL